ncbi:MAG TPA: thiamine-phosphate kinase [Terriglobia bacterium]|nr:thiamine-phosphate kinase [Terriglobia bacterium]
MFATEHMFVRWLQRQQARRPMGLHLGIGDDAALVEPRAGRELILTTDLSIEDVHFLPQFHPPRAVGHRALARSLSDVAAMGGIPRFALISLAISRRTTQAWLEEFYAGVFALARRFAVAVVGGDTAIVSGATTVDATVLGEVAKGKAILRSGARPGDQLFVSGRLGLSALGLRSIEQRAERAIRKKGLRDAVRTTGKLNDALQAHFYPEPRCHLGRFLGQKNLASSLIDLSDGLSTDLARLSEASHVGARVWAERIPVPASVTLGGSNHDDALSLALNGGEDYELLFTVPSRKVPQVPREYRGVPLHHIGEIRRAKTILLKLPGGKEVALWPLGYDHFKKLGFAPPGRRTNSR